MSREVPEPWASRMVEKKFTDTRYDVAAPSMSRLAEAIGVHTSTVSSAIRGTRKPSAETVAALAEALGADVAQWLGGQYHGPWEPPAASALLTDRQRKAVEEIIHVMTERQEQPDGTPIAPQQQDDPPAEATKHQVVRTRTRRPTSEGPDEQSPDDTQSGPQ